MAIFYRNVDTFINDDGSNDLDGNSDDFFVMIEEILFQCDDF